MLLREVTNSVKPKWSDGFECLSHCSLVDFRSRRTAGLVGVLTDMTQTLSVPKGEHVIV